MLYNNKLWSFQDRRITGTEIETVLTFWEIIRFGFNQGQNRIQFLLQIGQQFIPVLLEESLD